MMTTGWWRDVITQLHYWSSELNNLMMAKMMMITTINTMMMNMISFDDVILGVTLHDLGVLERSRVPAGHFSSVVSTVEFNFFMLNLDDLRI